ncbi:nucleotidyltransferase domain-containing protein [Microcoleus sp. FACHB-1515]|uniref:nucleotidyltransferase domain-containing protein n=1 Tax=Cyanophyceae TaxID=3028117 RepID=UPI001688B775|nr:nucleotidyltransferase domain-containing protein [Microcoleus sp. FACHB-1515]MBD2089056.1 nucleotidyltransferase domain-containing protein [Microcoleus sp. FACHB-1515]
MLDQQTLNTILQQLRSELEKLYGDRLIHVILFGSQARGDAEAHSDIDVLVVLNHSVEPAAEAERSSHFVTALCLKYQVLIACVFVSRDRFIEQQGGFLRNVHREGILV